MWCALVLVLCATLVLAMVNQADPGPASSPNEYRVEVETILEPLRDAAVYRVRVWTPGERTIYLDLDGGQITQPLPSRTETGSGVWHADLVILVALRPNPDATLRQNASELECRLLGSGGKGITFVDRTGAGAKLEDVVKANAGVSARRFGEKHLVAHVNGKAIEVWATG